MGAWRNADRRNVQWLSSYTPPDHDSGTVVAVPPFRLLALPSYRGPTRWLAVDDFFVLCLRFLYPFFHVAFRVFRSPYLVMLSCSRPSLFGSRCFSQVLPLCAISKFGPLCVSNASIFTASLPCIFYVLLLLLC